MLTCSGYIIPSMFWVYYNDENSCLNLLNTNTVYILGHGFARKTIKTNVPGISIVDPEEGRVAYWFVTYVTVEMSRREGK